MYKALCVHSYFAPVNRFDFDKSGLRRDHYRDVANFCAHISGSVNYFHVFSNFEGLRSPCCPINRFEDDVFSI
ncbi:hypothetical protein D3C74_280880 [compost metagenome]